MSDKRGWNRVVCDCCARITKRDMDRKYCPVAAANIHRNKPADRCKFFAKADRGFRDGGRDDDVC